MFKVKLARNARRDREAVCANDWLFEIESEVIHLTSDAS
jgi:hypothetical protein